VGAIIGAGIGLAGTLLGGSSKKSGANAAQGLDLTGYNYLTSGAGSDFTKTAAANGVTGSNNSQNIQNQEGELLGTRPITDQTKTAFDNYLGSTGYNFQLDQGTRAITGSAASRGLLNSGSTAKALVGYGQGLGSQYFNNYLSQLGSLNTQAANSATQGQNAVSAAAGAGSAGGVAAGNAAQNGGNAMGDAIAKGAGIAGSAVANNWSGISNFFGSI
jgi:hypothetical protein